MFLIVLTPFKLQQIQKFEDKLLECNIQFEESSEGKFWLFSVDDEGPKGEWVGVIQELAVYCGLAAVDTLQNGKFYSIKSFLKPEEEPKLNPSSAFLVRLKHIMALWEPPSWAYTDSPICETSPYVSRFKPVKCVGKPSQGFSHNSVKKASRGC